ncbi:MAG: alpha/beta hydrolase [Pseudomonadota bacterium]
MTEPTLNYVNCPDANGGHRMAYWQWGRLDAAHVIVCAHGLSRQGRDFDTLAQALCDASGKLEGGVRIICPDVAGRGASDWLKDPMGYQVPAYAADMLAMLGQLHAQTPITTLDWVGTSMGGLIGIILCGQPGLSDAGPRQGAKAPLGGSAAREAASVGAPFLPVPIRKLVLNDVGPAIEWQALVRIGQYLGQAGEFESVQAAADAMWAVSTGFGPHTPEQWLALSQHMVKPVSDAPGSRYRLHYDPAMAIPFRQSSEEATQQGATMLWQLYDNIQAQTLLIRGANSDLLNPGTAKAMTERGPRARLVEFAGVGHAPTLIAEDQVAAVTGFLLD